MGLADDDSDPTLTPGKEVPAATPMDEAKRLSWAAHEAWPAPHCRSHGCYLCWRAYDALVEGDPATAEKHLLAARAEAGRAELLTVGQKFAHHRPDQSTPLGVDIERALIAVRSLLTSQLDVPFEALSREPQTDADRTKKRISVMWWEDDDESGGDHG